MSLVRAARPHLAHLLRNALLRTTALVAATLPMAAQAQNLPTGGQVVAGSATIATAGRDMTVTTGTQRTVIDWSSFSIGTDHRLTINQPDAGSINVNRVLGTDPSKIFGTVTSNGRVVVANPNGIWFSPTARVDVAGIIASAGRISDASIGNFMVGGSLTIDAGNAGASVINDGVITAARGGFAALVAPSVRNAGTINARLGQVTLASGRTTTVDFYGDGLINLAVAGRTESAPLDAAVENKGSIYAEGGHVLLSADVAEGLLNNVINMSGAIEARGISTAGGVVELLGGTGSVEVAGRIDVSAAGAQDGGRITIKAGDASASDGVLNLTGTLDASAVAGKGGSIAADARFAFVGGTLKADGAVGGTASIRTVGITQSGTISANATDGAGGSITLDAMKNITQTISAVTSANSISGAGGTVTARSGDSGRTFSSGTLTATGATGGTVQILGNDIALAAARVDASGTVGRGGAVLVGGDLHGIGLQTADTTLVNGATTLKASGGTNGDGGRVVVWSDQKTSYQGSALARGGSTRGNGGMIEVSSANLLEFGGSGDAGAVAGKAGTLLLDPKNIVIAESTGGFATFELLDPNAGAGTGFGTMTAQLSNGTIVVTKPGDEVGGASEAGSVYFYDPQTGGLIATFQGSHAGDKVSSGSGGDSLWGSTGLLFLDQTGGYDPFTYLPTYDGTKPFLILSPNWNAARGAVTWVGANSTVSGLLSASNSLVGGTAGDRIGTMDNVTNTQVDILSSGNYVVRSPHWNDNRGAITFGTAASGITGIVSAANSLVGSTSTTDNGDGRKGDYLGSGGIHKLANGNFLVLSPYWNKMGGAVTFGSGTSGFASLGTLSSANSLVGNGGVTYSTVAAQDGRTIYGFYGGDNVGASTSNIHALSNGDFVIASTNWGHGRGAVTLGSGTTGVAGTISASNSLVGTTKGIGDTSDGTDSYYTDRYGNRSWYGGDQVGSSGIVELASGGFVVRSPYWSTNKGALTFVQSGTTSLSGTVGTDNSLTGSTAGTPSGYNSSHQQLINGGDQVGSSVIALANGNYVAATANWDGGKGAVTLLDGTTGQTVTGSSGSAGDTISAANSLVGSSSGDRVGNNITKLVGTSDFVVSTSTWDLGKGAVTRISGTNGLAGTVSAANSLVGTTSYEQGQLGADNVGGGGIHALSTGAWVILSPNWSKTKGAVTFVASGAAISGTISASNSLVGATAATGGGVYCTTCNGGGPAIFGGDQLGLGGILELSNGNFLIKSPEWNERRGAVTFVNGMTGALVDGTGSLTGSVSAANSLVGTQAGTVYTSAYNNFGTNRIGMKYYVGGDQVGSSDGYASFTELANGNFLLSASRWHNNTGAITFGTAEGRFGDGSVFAGELSSANSLVGSTAGTLYTPGNTTTEDYRLDHSNGDRIGNGPVKLLANGKALTFSSNWNDTRGAISLFDASTGLTGVVSASNSLVGTYVGDKLGEYGDYYTAELANGDVLLLNSNWNGAAGALTQLSSNGPITGEIDSSNSLVGNAGDGLGGDYSGIHLLSGGGWFVNSPGANGGAGAITYSAGTTPITGTLSEQNSFYGDANAASYYGYGVALKDSGTFLMNFSAEGSGRVALGFTDPTGWTYARAQSQTLTIAPSLITKALNSGTALVLQANNDITIKDAIIANAGATGSLTLEAGRSILGHANISLGTGALTLLANNSVANGVVDAYRDTGNAVISFDAGTSITTTGAVSATLATSTDKTNNGAGDITLGTISAGHVTVRNAGTGSINLGGTITAMATGTSILLATGGAFSNSAGANALDPGAGRFLLYSADPRNNTLGGLTADGKYYGRSFGSDLSGLSTTDNLFLYSVVPTLTITGNVTVGYGDAASSVTPQISGFIDGDTAATALSGAAATSTNYQAGDAVGGSYALTVSQGTLASTLGYALNFVDGTVTVTPKQLSLALIGSVTREYDGTTGALLTSGNYHLTGLYGSDSITIGNFAGNFSSANAGSGLGVSVNLSSGDFSAGGSTLLSNYVLPTGITTANIGTITPKQVALTGLTAQSRTYDGTAIAALSGGTLSGVISGDTLGFTVGSGLFADKNVGQGKSVTLSGYTLTGASAGNYVLTQPANLTADITAKALTLSGVTAQDRVYDGTTIATLSGGTLTGIVGSDVVTLVTGTGSFANKHVGAAKIVTASGFGLSGADAGNYSLSGQPTGLTATISAKALTLSDVTAADRAYDGTTLASLSGGTLVGIVGSDAVSFSAGTGSFADKNAGTNKSVTASGFSLTGADAGNYTLLGQPSGLTATISAKALDVLGVTASDRDYDGTTIAQLSGGTLSGIVGDDAVTLVTGSGAFLDKNVGTNKLVTLAGYGLSGTDAGNYTLAQPADLTATISAKTLTLSGVTAIDRVYDGTTTVALSGGTLAGIISGDAVALVTGSGSLADKNVGANKAVSASGFGLGGADAGNYSLSGQPSGLSATISAKTITLSGLTAQDRDYDGTTSVTLSGGTLAGVVEGDAVGLVTGTGSFSDKNVGTNKTVSVSGYGLSGGDAGNYVLAGQPTGLSATIAPKALTLSGVTAANRTYDGTTAVSLSGGTLLGIIGSELVSLVTGSGQLADKNIGVDKAVIASGYGISGTDAANYVLAGQPTGLTATISAKTLTLAGVTAQDRVYDGTTNAVLTGGTLTGIVGSDVVTLVTGTGSFANKHVGTNKTITVSGFGLSGADAANYVIGGQPTGLTASVTPKTLLLTGVTAQDRAYDGTTAVALSGGTLSGIVGDDAISLIAGSGALADRHVGANKTVAVTGFGLSGADAANYALSGQPSGLSVTITPRAVTLSGVTAIDRDYDGTSSVALTDGTLSGLIATDAVSLVRGTASMADRHVGVGKAVSVSVSGFGLAGADAGNYAFQGAPAGLSVTIAPKAVTLTGVTAVDRAYDGTTSIALAGGTLSGLIATDEVALVQGSGAVADKAAGTAKRVTVSGFGLSGADAGNYALAGQPSDLSVAINPAQLSISLVPSSISKTYDGSSVATLNQSSYRIEGLVAGETIGLANSRGSFATANAGSDLAVSVSLSLSDYIAGTGTSLANYALPTGTVTGSVGTILPALLLVRADDQTKVAGDPMPTFSVSYKGFKGTDSAASLGFQPTISTSATAQSSAGGYAIQVSGGQLANYSVTYEPGLLTVTPPPVQVPVQALIVNQPTQTNVAAPVNSSGQTGGVIANVGTSTAFLPTAPVTPPQVTATNIGSSTAGVGSYDAGAQNANSYANAYLTSIKLESQQ